MMFKVLGFDVCKLLRKDNNKVFIILFIVKGEEMDWVFGLEFGVDDYIVKLFSLRELLVRIKVVLRRI